MYIFPEMRTFGRKVMSLLVVCSLLFSQAYPSNAGAIPEQRTTLATQSVFLPLSDRQVKDIAMLKYVLLSSLKAGKVDVFSENARRDAGSLGIDLSSENTGIEFRFDLATRHLSRKACFVPCSITSSDGVSEYKCFITADSTQDKSRLSIEFFTEEEASAKDLAHRIITQNLAVRKERREIDRALESERIHDEKIRRAIASGEFIVLNDINYRLQLDSIYAFLDSFAPKLSSDLRFLVSRDQLMIITGNRKDSCLEEPHAGGRGIYLPSDSRYFGPEVVVHEIFAKAGFTHDECSAMQGLFVDWLEAYTDAVADDPGEMPSYMRIGTEASRILKEAGMAGMADAQFVSMKEFVKGRDYSSESGAGKPYGLPAMMQDIPGGSPTVLILGPYSDKLGEDLVLFEVLLKRLIATFPEAKIKVAMDYPEIVQLDETISSNVEILEPTVLTENGKPVSRIQLINSERKRTGRPFMDSNLFLMDTWETIEREECDLIIDLVGDLVESRAAMRMLSKKKKVLPYIVSGFRVSDNTLKGKDSPMSLSIHDREGKVHRFAGIGYKNIYDTLEKGCDAIGLERAPEKSIQVPEEEDEKAREFLRERLNAKGAKYDPSKPVVMLNMFAIANFRDSAEFMEHWRAIAEDLSQVKDAYVLVSLGNKTASNALEREKKVYRRGEHISEYPNLYFNMIAEELEKSSENAILLDRPSGSDFSDQKEKLRQFIGLMSISDIVITPDTGTLHLAHFMDKPTLLIADRDKDLWFPPDVPSGKWNNLLQIQAQQAYIDFVRIFRNLSIAVQTNFSRRYGDVFEMIGTAVSESDTVEELCGRILRGLRQAVKFDYAVIGHYEVDRQNIWGSLGYGSEAEEPILHYRRDTEVAGILSRGECFYDPEPLPESFSGENGYLLEKYGLGELFTVPLEVDDVPWGYYGYLQIALKEGKYLSEEDARLMKAVKQLIAVGIKKILKLQELKDKNLELNESNDRNRRLVEMLPIGLHVIDPRGRIIDVNRRELEILGYSREEMVGRSIFDFVVPEQREDARKRFEAKLNGLRRQKQGDREYLTKDGRRIIVSTVDTVVRDGEGVPVKVETALRDITHHRETEKALESSKKQFEELFIESPIGIMEIDQSGRIIMANESAINILGLGDPASIYGVEFGHFLGVLGTAGTVDHLSEDIQTFEMALDYEQLYGLEYFDFRKKGRAYLEWRITELGEGDRSLVQLQDITEKKEAERALRKAMEELEKNTSRLVEAEKFSAISGNTTALAHEINNPTSNIINLINELLVRVYKGGKIGEDELEKALKLASGQARRIAEVVERYMRFARMAEPGNGVVDVGRVITEVLEIRKSLLDSLGVSLSCSLSYGKAVIIADREDLKKAFLSLLMEMASIAKNGSEKKIEVGLDKVDGGGEKVRAEFVVYGKKGFPVGGGDMVFSSVREAIEKNGGSFELVRENAAGNAVIAVEFPVPDLHLEEIRRKSAGEADNIYGSLWHDINNVLAMGGYFQLIQGKMADPDPLHASLDRLNNMWSRIAGLVRLAADITRGTEVSAKQFGSFIERHTGSAPDVYTGEREAGEISSRYLKKLVPDIYGYIYEDLEAMREEFSKFAREFSESGGRDMPKMVRILGQVEEMIEKGPVIMNNGRYLLDIENAFSGDLQQMDILSATDGFVQAFKGSKRFFVNNGITFKGMEVMCRKGDELIITADGPAYKFALYNILSMGMSWNPLEGETISGGASKEVSIRIERNRLTGEAVVSFENNYFKFTPDQLAKTDIGNGIQAPAVLKWQGEESNSLAVANGILTAFCGRMEMDNTEDGSLVTVYLPCRVDVAEAENEYGIKGEKAGSDDFNGIPAKLIEGRPNILVADDEPLQRDLMMRALQEEEVNVWLARDGREALDMVLSAGERGIVFDLGIFDVIMPPLGRGDIPDGLILTRKIRQEGFDFPVLIHSGHATGIDDIRVLEKEGLISGLMEKTVSMEEKMVKIEGALQGALPRHEKALRIQIASADKVALVFGDMGKGSSELRRAGFRGEIRNARNEDELISMLNSGKLDDVDIIVNTTRQDINKILSNHKIEAAVIDNIRDSHKLQNTLLEVCA
ncbi:MAG: PAS domain S-box protein [Candidatus Omnitrophica bacterium]|nr:PAS domain S-box protein [Candidatus Omnitrophota bacterium]